MIWNETISFLKEVINRLNKGRYDFDKKRVGGGRNNLKVFFKKKLKNYIWISLTDQVC